jgi:hypothetical protein
MGIRRGVFGRIPLQEFVLYLGAGITGTARLAGVRVVEMQTRGLACSVTVQNAPAAPDPLTTAAPVVFA